MATVKRTPAPAGQKTPETAASAVPLAEFIAERVRRGLLVLLTAALVARPAIRGESLGLVSELSDPGGLIWTLFLLLGCGIWAAWRSWTGRVELALGRVEMALLALVVLVFALVPWAAYQRAALMGGYELLGLVLLLFLTRQLATSEREKNGLYTVLLSVGVALAVQGAYQFAYELPRERVEALKGTEGPRFYVMKSFDFTLEPLTDGEREVLTQRILGRHPHASYLYPSSLAAVLALLLPGLFAAALFAWRGGAERWQWILALFAVVLAAFVLVVTGEWLTLLAAVVALGLILGSGRWLGLIGGVAGAVGLGAVLYASGAMQYTLTQRSEAWVGSWNLLRSHLWAGLGAGHFPLYYPAIMQETDGAPPVNASAAPFDLLALGGIGALVAFLAAMAFLAAAVLRWWHVSTPSERDSASPPPPELPWEFYLGGMVGVLFAFVVRTSAITEADVLKLALLAGIGSLAWFGAYALFEQFTWTPAQRVLALSAGIFGMGLALLVGPGIDQPAVLAFLFAAVGMLLAHVEPAPNRWLSRPGLATGLPAPLFLGGAFAFLILVVVPACHTAIAIRQARLAVFVYETQPALSVEEQTIRDPLAFLRDKIIEPLRQAEREERGVVRTNAMLARWIGEQWVRLAGRDPDAPKLQLLAIEYAGHARTLCSLPDGPEGKIKPVGSEGLMVEWTIRQLFTRRLLGIASQLEKEAKDPKMPKPRQEEVLKEVARLRTQARDAARQTAEITASKLREMDPTNPSLAYLEALLWDLAGAKAKRADAIEEALRLDERVGEARRLTNAQKGQIEAWQREENSK